MKKIFAVIFVIFIFYFINTFSFAQEKNKVVAYYFHGNFRCYSCRFIEENTGSALKEYFDNQLKSGEVVFKHINVEEKENRHFVDDYQLYTKSVILSLVKDGKEVKWKNLDKVWQLLRNKDRFYEYIKTEAEKFLNELGKSN